MGLNCPQCGELGTETQPYSRKYRCHYADCWVHTWDQEAVPVRGTAQNKDYE